MSAGVNASSQKKKLERAFTAIIVSPVAVVVAVVVAAVVVVVVVIVAVVVVPTCAIVRRIVPTRTPCRLVISCSAQES